MKVKKQIHEFWRTILVMLVLVAPVHAANVDILIVGSTGDTKTTAFNPTSIKTYLENILGGAGVGTVNVVIENRGSPYDLAAWFHYPYPAGVETSTRWPNLRGESGTDWDYVVVIGDLGTIETMPGLYAQGVAMVAQEVAKGGAETILLMPWPKGNSSSVAHYKEVVYRAGRSGPYKVAPAGLAWQAAGSPNSGTAHPTVDGAFIAAASIYSTIWNQSASASTYVYNDTMANTVHTAVTTNNSASQYSGNFSFQNPFLMLGDTRRDVHFSEKGTSTEQDFKNSANAAMGRARVTYNSGSYSDKYTSNTPEDDAKGWPVSAAMPIAWNHGRKFSEVEKEYVTNPAYWQLGMGYKYQYNTWADTVEDANDTHISQIMSQDIGLANHMRGANNMDAGQHSSARVIPWRLIWAQMHQYNSTLNPLRDGSGPHLNNDLHKAVGTYMYTLYSGRCPLDVAPDPITTTWYANKIGYETAWRLGRCQTRAPGFKVMPSAATKKTITGGTTETMTVQFILPPLSDVTVNITSSNPSVATVSPAQLTFSPANHSTAQTITVTALNGLAANADFDVVFNTASSDEVYQGLSDSWRYTALAILPVVSWNVASQSSVNESGTMTVTAQLNAASIQPVTVPFTVSGTATLSTDYTITASPLTIPAGATTATATISIKTDTTREMNNETVILTMGTPTNATLGAQTVHTATITDDDNAAPLVDAGLDQEVTLNGQFIPWSPTDIVKLAWYDASDAATVLKSGTAVTSWRDKSGNGNHANQGTAGNQPVTGTRTIGSLNAIDFTRTGSASTRDYLNMTTELDFVGKTVMAVFVADNTTAGQLFGGKLTNKQILVSGGALQLGALDNNWLAANANGNVSGTSTFGSSPVLGQWDGDDPCRFYVNGTQDSKTYTRYDTTVWGMGQIGSYSNAGQSFDGLMGELMVLPSAPSLSDRQQLEGYLAHKWGLAESLPSGHPYEDLEPRIVGVSVTLEGSASDPNLDPITTTWSVVSQPAGSKVAFRDPSSPSTTVDLTTAGTYTLRLTATETIPFALTAYNEMSIIVTSQGTYSNWSSGPFANPFTDTAMTSNPDGDRRSNLMEFAFGTDPTLTDMGSLSVDGSKRGDPLAVKEGGGGFALYYIRRTDHGSAGSVIYSTHFSSNLTTFEPSQNGLQVVGTAGNGYELVKVPFPTGTRFGYVKVESAP